MTSRIISIALILFLIVLTWTYLGIEQVDREDGADYYFFTKQSPSFKLMYKNTVLCGECDLRKWSLVNDTNKKLFREYCAVRFGLEVRPCYAIFAEEQRMANEGFGSAKSTP